VVASHVWPIAGQTWGTNLFVCVRSVARQPLTYYEPLEQSLQEFPADFAGSNLEPLGTGYEAFVAGRFCSAAM
jgi:hypothetical protein